MNPVTFNDSFENDVLLLEKDDIVRPTNGAWKTKPLFVHETTDDHVISEILATSKDWSDYPASPFLDFRLHLTVVKGEIRRVMKCLVNTVPTPDGLGSSKLNILANVVRGDDGKPLAYTSYFLHCFSTHDLPSPTDQVAENYVQGLAFNMWVVSKSKVHYPDTFSEELRDNVKDCGLTALKYIEGFLVDCMSPSVHMAQVTPAKNGKSVEWVRARTHFTFISHGHPANNNNVRHGDSVAVDATKELHRMAHNRRAHYKTLRHERFRFARGKRIFIKAAWVGPKEWRDEGGKQIYRILEPVDSE